IGVKFIDETISQAERQAIEGEFSPGESIVWLARPSIHVTFVRGSGQFVAQMLVLFCAVLWFLFSVFPPASVAKGARATPAFHLALPAILFVVGVIGYLAKEFYRM